MIRVHRLPAGREVRIGEFEAMIRMCREDKHPAMGWRDIAMFGLLYICGLRQFEVIGVDVEHYDRETSTLRVIGKGNKERLTTSSRNAKNKPVCSHVRRTIDTEFLTLSVSRLSLTAFANVFR